MPYRARLAEAEDAMAAAIAGDLGDAPDASARGWPPPP